jgi:translation initiation factor IF-3
LNKFDRNKETSTKKEQVVRTNYNIRCPNIKLVGTEKVISNGEAQRLAQSKGMDLVEVNFTKTKEGMPISICKIIDYGKYLYEKKRREKEANKRARANRSELKNIQFHITSDSADVERKCNKAREILIEGDKVRLEKFLRGREESLVDMIDDMMNNLLNHFTDIATIESGPKKEGRRYLATLRPGKPESKPKKFSNNIRISIGN